MNCLSLNLKSRQKALLIAEVAQAHEGSLGLAHSFIDSAKEAGADAIKFQIHYSKYESSKDELFRIAQSGQDASRYDYWRRMEFSDSQWFDLARHATDSGLFFIPSIFSVAALDFALSLGPSAIKIGSAESSSNFFSKDFSKINSPVMVSSGMSTWAEINDLILSIQNASLEYILFQCTSLYPTPLEKVGLNVLRDLMLKFEGNVGLSDHSASIWPSIFAMQIGAKAIECHVTYDRQMYGPDSTSSLTFAELGLIRDARDALARIEKSPVDKDSLAGELEEMRILFGRSLAPAMDLSEGTILSRKDLTFKKPGTGIPANMIERVIGKRLLLNVDSRTLLSWDHLE